MQTTAYNLIYSIYSTFTICCNSKRDKASYGWFQKKNGTRHVKYELFIWQKMVMHCHSRHARALEKWISVLFLATERYFFILMKTWYADFAKKSDIDKAGCNILVYDENILYDDDYERAIWCDGKIDSAFHTKNYRTKYWKRDTDDITNLKVEKKPLVYHYRATCYKGSSCSDMFKRHFEHSS